MATVMDWIDAAIKAESGELLTLEEFTDIRNNGSEEEIAEAVERMMAQGGYENLA